MMLSIMVLSTMMVVSSTNLLMIWLSLELNLFSFIPLLMNKMNTNETEASINYFLSQTLGSSMMLMSSINLLLFSWMLNLMMNMFMLSIILKMGMVPCHFWYPYVMEKTTWMNCLILSTWQKIAPMFILLFIITPYMKNMMVMVSAINTLIGGMMGLMQVSMKKIMAYSSITHMGWMLSGTIMNTSYLSIIYFIMYSMMIMPLFKLFNHMNMEKVYDLWNQKMLMMHKMLAIIMLLSLAGLPPLTGFTAKLLMISMLSNYNILIIMILIMGSLLNLSFYMNMAMNMMMNMSKTLKNNMKLKKPVLFTNMLLAINLFMLIIMTL